MSAKNSDSLLYDVISSRLKSDRRLRDLVDSFKFGTLPVRISGPKEGFAAYLVSRLARESGKPIILLVSDDTEAQNTKRDLTLFGILSEVFSWYGTAPYQDADHKGSIEGSRQKALYELQHGTAEVLIAPLRSITTFISDANGLGETGLELREGQTLDSVALAQKLTDLGYWRVPKVTVQGEFALRGEVIDLFSPGHEDPVRLLLDFDLLSEIRIFDVFGQQTIDRQPSVVIFPVVGARGTAEDIRKFTEQMNRPEFRYFAGDVDDTATIPTFWLPDLRNSYKTLLDMVPDSCRLIWMDHERLKMGYAQYETDINAVYDADKYSRPLPEPEKVIASLGSIEEKWKNRSIFIETLFDAEDSSILRFQCDPARSYFGNISFLKEELTNLTNLEYRIFVFADTDAQRQRIAHLLSDYPNVTVLVARISSGFTLPEAKITVIQESEIFGRRRREPASLKRVKSTPIDTFVELEEGDPVVHVNYGIGKFCGITRMRAAGNERDYIKVEYANEEMIFVPIEQVNLIQRYIGSGGNAPRLDTIGGKSWERRKATVRKNVEDLADRLIRLYSRRRKALGFKFSTDTEWQLEFESSFPYEETPDQLRCIEEVKHDMELPTPMDRLVCGDVGYGKTEVALRAAFKAVTEGKQVAFLAPTTILTEQHFETIQERFEPFPVRIAMLSRFVAKNEQKQSLTALLEGTIDLVVGTHRLLQKDVRFKDLGLLIIDEEQRFGVKAKEVLKEMKTSIDCLTLTATPIPRTLHMSLLEIRDMSLLTTPPRNRHPIETTIAEFNEETISRAVRREIDRGGQVFFLHNRVETLDNVRRFIETILPEVLVDVAHGQMSGSELEDIMHRFVHGAFQVLVATTIIENGIDIPNVNTIIIDRADMYGISQLYQLRGRVGRSDRVAYAYLFYPEERALSEIAMKRLQIISDFTELGSGFKIALKDLEVRGAGNLLGHQQSGDILSVGFDMYLRLLDEAVREMSDGSDQDDQETYLELEYTGFIPDNYISDMMEKMEVYKRIAGISDIESLNELIAEMNDRFGSMPDEVSSLLALSELRILAIKLHLSSLRERSGVLRVEFSRVAGISVERLLALISTAGGSIRLDPKAPNVLVMDTSNVGLKEKSEFIRDRLSQLM